MPTHPLDDLDHLKRLDPKGMYDLTVAFPDQCRQALAVAREVDFGPAVAQAKLAALTGLGGSAAGGDLVRCLFEDQAGVPFLVNRDYELPNFVGVGDVVFATSYSGNTEETLSAYEHAKRLGARLVVVTSGGRLAELARQDGNTLVVIPGGQPPRTALGFMTVPVIAACEAMRFLPEQPHERAYALLEECARDWGVDTPFEQNEAKQLAQALHGKLPILYGLGGWQALVANRWKGQINENSKNMAFANAFPELNHNEILGWVKAGEQGVASWVVVYLESGQETQKIRTRGRVTEELIRDLAAVHRVRARGESLYERLLSLTYLGDFVSIYLASLNGVDPENIDSINILKAELSKIA